MILAIPDLVTPDECSRLRALLAAAPWTDGRLTAGPQSASVKNNRQLPEDCREAREAGAIVEAALARNPTFFSAALPRRIYPPLFNRYDGETNAFGNHVDNAIRRIGGAGEAIRTDLSATLFLVDPGGYDGGELVIEDTFGTKAVKLPAGHMVLYPSSSVHRVEPVTSGTRVAAFFWLESMVRGDERRRLLFELDTAITSLRAREGESAEAVRLASCYHNLLRMWADA
jgi:PKHD-type hydroxylase